MGPRSFHQRPRRVSHLQGDSRDYRTLGSPATHAAQYAARHMIAQGRGGRIIGLSSILGKQGALSSKKPCEITDLSTPEGLPAASAYSAAKFAVRGLTQSAGTFYPCGAPLESHTSAFMLW